MMSVPARDHRLPILVFAPDFGEPTTLGALRGLGYSTRIDPTVLTSSQNKQHWLDTNPPGARLHGYADVAPAELAARNRLLVIAGEIGANAPVRCLVNSLVASGGILVDATQAGVLSETQIPHVRAGPDLSQIEPFLREAILPNLTALGHEARNSAYAERTSLTTFLEQTGLPVPAPSRRYEPARDPALVFMPTNGNGLGHARRCTLIARETNAPTHFAAFPSCVPLVRSAGFDVTPLVARSPGHAHPWANDLVNYSRLRHVVAEGDVFAFDGGYVFESVLRTVREHRLRSVWIRRGLWRPDQDNRHVLDAEQSFDRVVVPSEAFDELNRGYTRGPRLAEVGPIVQRVSAAERAQIRAALAARVGRPFQRLVVTQLGAGVAADLSAHVQAVCAEIETRADTVNLILVWPSGVVHPAWYGWQNSQVVSTHYGGRLAAASDMIVSAAGYNAFHEAMYNAVPAIFVPQVAPYMDDQGARAEAAAERGVARVISPTRPSETARELARFLDRGVAEDIHQALRALTLPEPGNGSAARVLEELIA